MKPSEEQVKEFWELIGVEIQEIDGTKQYIYPHLDLNNLFKYAAPKLRYFSMHHDRKLGFLVSVDGGEDLGVAVSEDKDPAFALFWAIWEMIHEGGIK